MAPHVSRPDDSNSAHGAIPSLSQSYFQGNLPNLFRFIIADRRPVCNGFPADLTEVLPSLYNWYKILVGRGNFCAAQMQGHGLPPIPAFFFFLRKKKKKQKEERQRYPPLLCHTAKVNAKNATRPQKHHVSAALSIKSYQFVLFSPWRPYLCHLCCPFFFVTGIHTSYCAFCGSGFR